jgi:hypothetical protein
MHVRHPPDKLRPTAFAPLTVHPTESMLGTARCAALK